MAKLKFHTKHHALCDMIRKDTGMEILPSEVKEKMYIYMCWCCGEEQWTVEMKEGKLVRPSGSITCKHCGAVNIVKEEKREGLQSG